jgi:hypothetical protein
MKQPPQRPTDVLGSLPHRRPSRRSEKRGASAPADSERASGTRAARADSERASRKRAASPPAPSGAQRSAPDGAHQPGPTRPSGTEIIGTVVQAAAELAQIGFTVSTRALKEAVARLPRP